MWRCNEEEVEGSIELFSSEARKIRKNAGKSLSGLMDEKHAAANRALDHVKNGMTVGFGTGSTFDVFLELLAQSGKKVKGVATSKKTAVRARELGFEILDLNEVEKIDVAIDGADEIDPKLNLVKGHGNALMREKIIDYRAKKFVVIADSSKLVRSLGEKKSIPIEVLPFGWRFVARELNCRVEKKDVITDNGNYILLADLKNFEPTEMEMKLNSIPGVVENGIFTKCDVAIVGEKVMMRD